MWGSRTFLESVGYQSRMANLFLGHGSLNCSLHRTVDKVPNCFSHLSIEVSCAYDNEFIVYISIITVYCYFF